MIEFRPATLADLAAVDPPATRRTFARLAGQIARFPAWALFEDSEPVAVLGLQPLGDEAECWLAVGARKPRLATLRALLMKLALVLPDKALLARVREDNAAGQRMMRLTGFEKTGQTFRDGTVRTWRRPPQTSQGGGGA